MKNLEGNPNISSPHTRGGGEGSDRNATTPSRSPLLKGEKSILFLSLSGIGNLVMQLPTIEALKKARPDWNITVWVAPRGTRELAEAQPFIDEVLEMQVKANILQHAKNILTLRKHHFDIAIMLSPGQLTKGALYMKLAGIPIRIGHTYPYKGEKDSTKFLTHAIPENPELHDIEQNLKLLDPLEITPAPVLHYSLAIPKESIQSSKSVSLKANEANAAISYVGIHAGSASHFAWKRWPLARFAELATMLHKKNPNLRFLIFGGPDEQDDMNKLTRMINDNFSPSYEGEREGVITNAFTPTSPPNGRGDSPLSKGEKYAAQPILALLLTTAAIIQQHCSLFISNDSGLMHIASAVGVPTVGLFGPTNENQTGPRGQKSIAVRASGTAPVYNTETAHSFGTKPHPAILALTPEIVFDKISDFFV